MNALGGPGLGHIMLGRRRRGCLFLLPTLACLGWFFWARLLPPMLELSDRLNAGLLPFDPLAIALHARAEVYLALRRIGPPGLLVALLWIGAIADSFLLAPAQKRGE
ncbi:hypothetical protein C7C56_007245 [Massilia glaciei]|uniref:Uncharacterized protein n=2 Tax=Massilia glaciei TaxID=1524097 RepID=A0A2U2HPA9_9BURK|nr:hypothetical protein C7C56_007245 [Massilia glaciei]